MALVDYSSSDADDDDDDYHNNHDDDEQPPAKRRQLPSHDSATASTPLPPLPATFHDLYSSTVRTTTRDDPSLHGGRKRVTPHVDGNWPTHVYLEWHPSPSENRRLGSLIQKQNREHHGTDNTNVDKQPIHSLLQNDLGVPLPLHISLSRPLVLTTNQKDAFLARLKESILDTGVRSFITKPDHLAWHSNEIESRWFLVLHLQQPERDELQILLAACNDVAQEFGQPLLYRDLDSKPASRGRDAQDDKFHISIAWMLSSPRDTSAEGKTASGPDSTPKDLDIPFSAIKVRIGQDVSTFALTSKRS
ncbi:Hypothetical protein R9X50_00454000 [Acrodontium crateriforme]|uniref:U6 snRNA phosphodiesterase n=1 Tax=Acrodontium crateriforme TaxID=150365 RepID=A0AAQ3M7T8_9PEZI|nr:Hypothetical protein R9X50_00454000 [Acrodontium crateriforme]